MLTRRRLVPITPSLLFGIALVALPGAVQSQPVTAVATYESIGLSWAHPNGSPTNTCHVLYRDVASPTMKWGYPLWFDSRDGEYRGSLVHLQPGRTHQIYLFLDSGQVSTGIYVTTWSEQPPILFTNTLPAYSNNALVITQGGVPGGYALYTGPGGGNAEIDRQGNSSPSYAIYVSASYVVLRNLTVRNASGNAIMLGPGVHDVIIEDCEITKWGQNAEGQCPPDSWGLHYNTFAIVALSGTDVERITIQRNWIHDPRHDANNWTEYRAYKNTKHPIGPQAVAFWNSKGNHVIRHNTIESDDYHMFNDILGYGSNHTTEGFPGPDSDIYGNKLSHCWDDAIEADGGGENVRIWGNHFSRCMIAISGAPVTVGPMYVWRNVVAETRTHDNWPPWNGSAPDAWGSVPNRGGFFKPQGGFSGSGGRVHIFHNTILQPPPPPGQGTLTTGVKRGIWGNDVPDNVITRNNIFQMTSSNDWALAAGSLGTNDFDRDLYVGLVSSGHELNGFNAAPVYVPGSYALQPGTPGHDQAWSLPGFSDIYPGTGAPDIGAQENGAPPLQFGH